MAEKPDARKGGEEAVASQGGKKKGKIFLLGAVGGAMLIEGVAVFFAAKMLSGGPQDAGAASIGVVTGGGSHGDAKKAESGGQGDAKKQTGGGKEGEGGAASGGRTEDDSEVVLAQFRAINDRSGQNILYDVKVYGRVKSEKVEKIQKLLEGKKATVEDRFAKVIRNADPQYFKEAGLETIRRQFMHELDLAFNEEGLISEILLPSLMWYNAGM